MGLFIMVGEYSFNGDSYTITSQRSYDAVCHVDLAFVHVVQHLFGALKRFGDTISMTTGDCANGKSGKRSKLNYDISHNTNSSKILF